MRHIHKHPGPQKGFATLELVLVVIVIAAVMATGYYVFSRQSMHDDTTTRAGSAPEGTSARSDHIDQDEIDKEATIEVNGDAAQQQNATSDSSSLDELGDASDASEL